MQQRLHVLNVCFTCIKKQQCAGEAVHFVPSSRKKDWFTSSVGGPIAQNCIYSNSVRVSMTFAAAVCVKG